MSIHVSGVGVLGAFVCEALARRQVPFTWDDVEHPANSWTVCTGAIIPYDDAEDSWYAQGYRFWREVVLDQPSGTFDPLVETVRLVYALKGVPGRLRASKPVPLAETPDGVRLWVELKPAWQLHAPQFVEAMRARFSEQRVAGVPDGAVVIRCWGVNDPDARPIPLWGWARLVRLEPRARCPFWATAGGYRVSLHFNDPAQPGARYYFQPLAGTDLWWAGSDRVRQKAPVQPNPTKYVDKFLTAAERVWGRWMTVIPADDVIRHGWRPEERNQAWKAGPPARWINGVLVPRPHARNGSQCGPLLAHTVVNMLLSPRRPV